MLATYCDCRIMAGLRAIVERKERDLAAEPQMRREPVGELLDLLLPADQEICRIPLGERLI